MGALGVLSMLGVLGVFGSHATAILAAGRPKTCDSPYTKALGGKVPRYRAPSGTGWLAPVTDGKFPGNPAT
jgi:hypothetical protein